MPDTESNTDIDIALNNEITEDNTVNDICIYLGNLCIPVATSHFLNVLQASTLLPLSWDNSVVVILPICYPLVDTWIPESHDVVQHATG